MKHWINKNIKLPSRLTLIITIVVLLGATFYFATLLAFASLPFLESTAVRKFARLVDTPILIGIAVVTYVLSTIGAFAQGVPNRNKAILKKVFIILSVVTPIYLLGLFILWLLLCPLSGHC